MNPLREQVFVGFDDPSQALRVGARLLAAAVCGAVLGLQREAHGKVAGLRTHMLVALGGALFMTVPLEAGVGLDHLSRVVQGIVVGIGFLGGGVIIKIADQERIRGVTTAANIWVTAALGMAIGAGLLWPTVAGLAIAWITLTILGRLERRLEGPRKNAEDRPK